MKKMLEELKRLDPSTYWTVMRNLSPRGINESGEGLTEIGEDILQGHIQRAIAEKGWLWGFSVRFPNTDFSGVISKDVGNSFIKLIGDSPSKAILATYVEALKNVI